MPKIRVPLLGRSPGRSRADENLEHNSCASMVPISGISGYHRHLVLPISHARPRETYDAEHAVSAARSVLPGPGTGCEFTCMAGFQ